MVKSAPIIYQEEDREILLRILSVSLSQINILACGLNCRTRVMTPEERAESTVRIEQLADLCHHLPQMMVRMRIGECCTENDLPWFYDVMDKYFTDHYPVKESFEFLEIKHQIAKMRALHSAAKPAGSAQ